MRAIKSVQKSLATEFYGACSSEQNKIACKKRFDVIKPKRFLVFPPLVSTNEKKSFECYAWGLLFLIFQNFPI